MLKSLLTRLFPVIKKTRLRHVLYLGSLLERQAEAFYRDCKDQARDPRVKALCHKLMEEEQKHYRLIDGLLKQWRSLSVDPADWKAMGANSKLQQLFAFRPESDTTEKEMLRYAIDEEKKMVAFYEDFEADFTDRWKLAKLRGMLEEERSHVTRLSDMLSGV